MAGQRTNQEEYEIVAYPKLNHVRSSIVQIVNRNTHVHRAFELALVLEGQAQVQIGERSFDAAKGSLFFFNPNEPHQIIATCREGIRIAYLQVATAFCSEYLTGFRSLELLQNDLSGYLEKHQLFALTERMVQALQDYMSENDELYALRCICSICQLFRKLLELVPYRYLSESDYLSRNKKMARLSRITEYIDHNYGEKITLEQLARREKVTVTYLSHFIRENLNMTFQEYVSSLRFERALQLLRTTSMCLTDVSVVSGFSDVKYLTRMLEKHFGAGAKEYRAQLYRQPEAPAREGQTFATETTARDWLSSFWSAYSQSGN